MTFTFDFEMSEAENVRGCRTVVNRQRSVRVAYVCFALSLLAGLGMLVGLAAIPAVVPRQAGLLSIVFIASGSVGLRTLYRTPRVTVQNLRKDNRAAVGPTKYVLDDHGLDVWAMGTRSTLEWANIFEAYEDKKFFFLYFAKAWAMLLPKRLISATELPAFRTALRGWVGERAHLLEG